MERRRGGEKEGEREKMERKRKREWEEVQKEEPSGAIARLEMMRTRKSRIYCTFDYRKWEVPRPLFRGSGEYRPAADAWRAWPQTQSLSRFNTGIMFRSAVYRSRRLQVW